MAEDVVKRMKMFTNTACISKNIHIDLINSKVQIHHSSTAPNTALILPSNVVLIDWLNYEVPYNHVQLIANASLSLAKMYVI